MHVPCGCAPPGRQIRCIAAVLLMVGRGLEAPSLVARLLDVTPQGGVPAKPQYNMAPEEPLLLYRCVCV